VTETNQLLHSVTNPSARGTDQILFAGISPHIYFPTYFIHLDTLSRTVKDLFLKMFVYNNGKNFWWGQWTHLEGSPHIIPAPWPKNLKLEARILLQG